MGALKTKVMKTWIPLCFLICHFGCGVDPALNIDSIDMKVADIEVLRYTPSDVKIVMYGLHRDECVATAGNVSYREEGNTIHVAPRVDRFNPNNPDNGCPGITETRVELWLRGLSIGQYTIFGYTRDEYGHPNGYSTEWLVFRVEADRVVIVRKSLNSNHEFQNRVTAVVE